VELVPYPPRQTLYEVLAEQFGGGPIGEGGLWTLLDARDRALGAATAPVRLFRRGEPLALMPSVLLR
jgi:hypothetical protein